VTDTYHGVDVTEDYRWLEDGSSGQTIAWAKAQQQRTRAYFGGIGWRDALRARVEELLKAERTTYKELVAGGSTFFALKVQTPRQRPFLVALTDLDDPATERVVVDPEAIDPSGETAIDFFVPSPDGRQVAVSLSEHGTEDGSLYVYDAGSGKVAGEPIPHVNLMGGSVAWRHDGSGFWYTRCADPAGFRQQVWFRELGGSPDHVDLAGGFADKRIAENKLAASPDGRWVMDRAQKGDGGEWQVFLRGQGAGGSWWQVAGIPDKCVGAVLGTDALYLLSRRDAPHGKVLRLPVTGGVTVGGAREIVPASDLVIEDLAVTRDTVWVVDIDGGPQQVRAFDTSGRPLPAVEIPPLSSVSSYSARLSALGQDQVGWSRESFTEPATWWVAADGEAPRPTALRTATLVDLSGYEVTREFATSRDGTRVPLNVITAPGTPRDGTAPALLTAYGGYGISQVPRFDPELLLWLEQGGVYVLANIRGGGELGEPWHHAGRSPGRRLTRHPLIGGSGRCRNALSSKASSRHPSEGGGSEACYRCELSAAGLPGRRVRVGSAFCVAGPACHGHACGFGGRSGEGPSRHGPGPRRELPAVPGGDLRHRPEPGARHRRRYATGHRRRPLGGELDRDLYRLGQGSRRLLEPGVVCRAAHAALPGPDGPWWPAAHRTARARRLGHSHRPVPVRHDRLWQLDGEPEHPLPLPPPGVW
jgi:prolyl oligopeptidase